MIDRSGFIVVLPKLEYRQQLITSTTARVRVILAHDICQMHKPPPQTAISP